MARGRHRRRAGRARDPGAGPRPHVAEPARRGRRRPALPRAAAGGLRRSGFACAGLSRAEPEARHPDLEPRCACALPLRPSGPGAVADRRPQAGLHLPAAAALSSAAGAGEHRLQRLRVQARLPTRVRRRGAGLRTRPRPDADLAIERTTPGREPRRTQHLRDQRALDRRQPALAARAAGQRGAAPPARPDGAQPCRQRPGLLGQGALQAAWRRSPWAARTQRAERPIKFHLAPDAPGACIDGPAPRP